MSSSSSISLRHIRRLSTAAAAATTPSVATAATTPSAGTATAAGKPTLTISKAKSKLRHEHDPDKALEIYTSLSPHYTSPFTSRYAQDITVKRLAKSRRFDDIEKLIESHKNDPKIKEEPFLATLIRSYGTAGMFNNAVRTYEEMEKFGTPRGVVSFNALLLAGIRCREYERVRELFKELPGKYGFRADTVSYGMLIKAYCEGGLVEEGLRVLREMEGKEGVEVSTVVYTTVLGALYKKGMVEEAEKLWGEMLRSGLELDVAAYNVRIMNKVGGRPEEVKALIDDMCGLGLKPDAISYNFLMTCYLKNGMIEEAKGVYEGLEGYGCRPNAATFRTMIFYLCKNEEYVKAYKYFKESVRVDRIPDFNTLKYLAEGLVKEGMTKEAKGMIRTIKKKFPPNFLNAWKKVEDKLGLASAADTESVSGEDQKPNA